MGYEEGFEGGPEGGGDVDAGCGAAFLALVFESAADGVDGCVVDVGAGVDEVVIFPACFADDARVASICAFGYVGGNFAVQAAKDGCAAGVVEAGEVAVGEHDGGYFNGIARDELDDVGGEAGFEEDAVDEVVGSDG